MDLNKSGATGVRNLSLLHDRLVNQVEQHVPPSSYHFLSA
jgi:hypothetical protein